MKTKFPSSIVRAALAPAFLTVLNLQLLTGSLTASVLTVTTLVDSGPGSLRDRVAASAAGDTIQFAVKGAIGLNSAISIPHNLNVQGPGPAMLVIDAGHVDRAFNITGNPVVLSGMTIANGLVMGVNGGDGGVGQNGLPGGDAYGGAILVTGTSDVLILSNCWVMGNTVIGGHGGKGGPNPVGAGFTPGAGGHGGFAGGGAVDFSGGFTNVGCTFSANRAIGGQGGDGGDNLNAAIAVAGGTGGTGGGAGGGVVYTGGGAGTSNSDCTFSGNSALGGTGGHGGSASLGPGGNGGAGAGATGGAINTFRNDFFSCTIVSNSAYGGMGGLGGTGTPSGFNGASGTGEAGGVAAYLFGGCLSTIGNTILADNYADGSYSNYLCTWTDAGYNFIGSVDFGGCPFGPPTQAGTVHIPIHPLLGPLAQNGGGLPTHAPVYGGSHLTISPVIDAGYSFGDVTDERGAPRPYVFSSTPKPPGGDGSDIGAFELGSTDLGAAVSSNNLVLSWPAFYGDLTLQSAAILGGSSSWSNVPDTPFLVGSQLVVTNPMTNTAAFYRLINH